MTIFKGDVVMEEGSKFLPLSSQYSLFISAAFNSLCLVSLLLTVTADTARLPTHHSHIGRTASCWKDHLLTFRRLTSTIVDVPHR